MILYALFAIRKYKRQYIKNIKQKLQNGFVAPLNSGNMSSNAQTVVGGNINIQIKVTPLTMEFGLQIESILLQF